MPAVTAEDAQPRKHAPARPERAPRPPQIEQPVAAEAVGPQKDDEMLTTAPVDAATGAPESKAETEVGQTRRRRGRRGGRRRRRHEDGMPMQDATPRPLDELDDEDREDDERATARVPGDTRPADTRATPTAASTASAGTGAAEPVNSRAETEASRSDSIGRAPRPAPAETLEAVTSAPAATAFNLPPLPPLAAHTGANVAVDAPVAVDVVARVDAPPSPVAPTWTQEASNTPAAPAAQHVERQAAVVETTAPASSTEAPAASSQPRQGELLSQGAAHPTASPAPVADNVHPGDTQPPKDAAQG